MSADHIPKNELETDSFMEAIGNILDFYKKNKLVVQWAAIGIVAVILINIGITRYISSQRHKALLAYENAKTEMGLSEFIANFPNSEYVALALFQKGNMLYEKEDYAGAMNVFAQLVEKYKKHELASFALLSIGYCQMAMGENVKAQEIFNKLIEQYPASPMAGDAKINLARSLLKSAQYEQAQKVIDEFLKAEPNSYLADEVKKMLPEIKRNL
ncbi:MAG: tetratricopeptide repeat protein [Candidatus Auribacterota bacterium]|nr:tetratricopeptide repeat protein [Candidatus Auribacterota bacterium]